MLLLIESAVLIETYWNVKINSPVLICYLPGVLIETYWNVKEYTINSAPKTGEVLIETYWNVKLSGGRNFR